MEQLLHYTWKHRLYGLQPLQTTDCRQVEVIDPGLHNRNAGPDFFNAKVKVDGTLWVGNIEIHDKASDWYLHGHDKDERYDNVVLHVCGLIDCEALNSKGQPLTQLQLSVPEYVATHYRQLLETDQYPPCYTIIPHLSQLTIHAWMSALQTERLSQKTEAIGERVRLAGGDWERALFVTLARNYGFGINGETFEQWALSLPFMSLAHHRDNLFQIEAIFMGQAGLLTLEAIPQRYHEAAEKDEYFQQLRKEYLYLQHKFSLQPIDHHLWRFLRLRPQNFPHIRLSQLANLYCQHKGSLSSLLEAASVKDAMQLLATTVTPYWETHYGFGSESKRNAKQLSPHSLQLLVINTVVPMLFAYGRHRGNEAYCDRAFDFLEQLKPESNHIVTMWKACGLSVDNAGDSQALIQLKNRYCDRKDCLRCRIGYEYLKKGASPPAPPQ